MKETLEIFDSIINSIWFTNTSIMLFFNKKDLFEAKLKISKITMCFPEYNGQNTFEETTKFISRKFEELNKSPEVKHIYSHYTCATDTQNIKYVFNIVTDIILEKNLKSRGIF